jgi:neutral ceramidase
MSAHRNYLVAVLLTLAALLVPMRQNCQAGPSSGWKAGVARVEITPGQNMWMAGFAARTGPSEGQLHPLWAKALALEDSAGRRVLLVTADLLGFPRAMSDRIRDRLKSEYALDRAQIALNASHTHSGPVLEHALYDIYPLDSTGLAKIEAYSRQLEQMIVDLAGAAIAALAPARICAQNGVTRFQVNRRNNNEGALLEQTELRGPNDYAVPVIRVADEAGSTRAIVFGYACHPTVLDQYQWSGDFPGFAQIELEAAHPGAMALFFQGAGGDQNPMPRRSVALARQFGRELAAAVDRVLEEEMQELQPVLSFAYDEIDLPLRPPPTEQELRQIHNDPPSWPDRWAARQIESRQRGEVPASTYPYPLQVWMLGRQPLLILGGELVVEYALDFKRKYGQDIFVMGYANDVMAYIPSETILAEGGYEGASSQMVYGLPSLWKPGIQSLILREMARVAALAGLMPAARE